jgi:DNA invertase Pin-like site-specific DNA recombinase
MLELNEMIARVLRAKAILLVVSGVMANQKIDGSIQSQTLVFALGLAAQIERELISERTKSALKARKAQGVKLGRPEGKSKLDAMATDIRSLQAKGVTVTNIARVIGVSRTALTHWLGKGGAR